MEPTTSIQDQNVSDQLLSPEKNRKMKRVIMFLILLLVIFCVLLVFYVSIIISTPLRPPVPVITPTPQPTTQTKEEFLVPSDWKTYTNEKYGFEIKYPPTWKLGSEPEVLLPQILSSKTLDETDNFNDGFITINVKSTPIEILLLITNEWQESSVTNFILDGRSAQKLMGIYSSGLDQGPEAGDFRKAQHVLISNGNVIISLEAEIKGTSLKDKSFFETFNQILSTFQFTNVSEIKKMENEKGFECVNCPKYTDSDSNWCKDGKNTPPSKNWQIENGVSCYCYGHPTCSRNP